MYFCVLNCNYKVAPALSLGKEVLCNRCGEKFIMNEYSLRLALPHCEKCHKSKNDTRIAKDRLPVEYNPENSVIPIEDPETVRQLIDTGVPPSSLSERLKQAINHTKIEDEDEI
jgi:ribosomal protein S27AE